MSRPIHFEIHADDVARATAFYGSVFGWTFEDWSQFAGMPYFGATTGEEGTPGINGAIMQRPAGAAGPGAPVNGAVLTLGCGDYDATHEKILAAGGQVAMPKAALPGMAWQGYYLDTEGNVFGLHQPDPEAK
ncbi:VOC family protein [Cumulibacter manganitolerans]|uniref:VOC family protein n=1 Tax=Cumulibacter manganitolerans TaxID=1884992 RepID=UPI0012953FD2|nr:VOC family protein [Cumulibacter manganitolerans]